MAKKYIQPLVEVIPVCFMDSICTASGAATRSISIMGGVSPSSYDNEDLFQ